MTRDWRTPLVVAAVGTVGMALALAGTGGAVRAWATMAFLLFGPGLAVVGRFDLGDPGLEVGAALAVSVAINTVVAMVMVGGGWWDPVAAFVSVGVPSVAALCAMSHGRRTRDRELEVSR